MEDFIKIDVEDVGGILWIGIIWKDSGFYEQGNEHLLSI